MTGPIGLHEIARRPWDAGSELLPAAALAGAQIRAGAEQLARLPALDRPRAFVVVGAAAEPTVALLTAVLGPGCPVPIVATPTLPVWVGPLDVVVVLAAAVDDYPAAEALATAVRRGASVITRAAAQGPVPAVAGRAGAGVLTPPVAVPEALAVAGRLTLLVGVAVAAGLLPPLDLGAVADQVDGIAVACHPSTDFFVNPALLLAEHVLAGPPVFLGLDPVGDGVVTHAVRSFAALGARPVSALPSTDLGGMSPLIARLAGGSADLFADPYADVDEDWTDPAERAAVVLVGAGDPGGAPGRPGPADRRPALSPDALPRALRIGTDEVPLPGRASDRPDSYRPDPDRPGPDMTGPDGPGSTGASRVGPAGSAAQDRLSALVDLLARIDFAAVYTGLVTGARPPTDAPDGLGPTGGALFRPALSMAGPPSGATGPPSGWA